MYLNFTLLRGKSTDFSSRQSSATVTLCVQTEDGKRSVGTFALSASLQDVLDQLSAIASVSEDRIPVIIYSSNLEVRGASELSKRSLDSLGFQAGKREMVKLKYSDPDREQQILAASGGTVKRKETKRQVSPPRRAMRVHNDGESMLEKLVGKTGHATDAKEESQDMEVVGTVITQSEKEDEISSESKTVIESNSPKEKEEEDMLEDDEEEGVIHYLDDAHLALVFVPSGSSQRRTHFVVDDSFFDVTVDEVRRRQAELTQEAQTLSEGAPLETPQARRERQRKKVLQTYPKTVVRVLFPDGLAIQAGFKSTDSVSDVAVLVRSFLGQPDEKFELFTAPPREVLDPNQSLADCGLVPTGAVRFSRPREEEIGQYLKPDVLSRLSNSKGAKTAVKDYMQKK